MSEALKIGMILSAKNTASRVIDKMVADTKKKFATISQMGQNMLNIGVPMAAAGAAATAFFAKTVSDAHESEIANKRLEQVFKSMGETTEKAAKDTEDFASKLQFKIGIDDEKILDVASKLATFKRASDDAARTTGVYNRAIQASFDLQANNFGDALSNITQLGKALQNPALGAQALSKAGAINKEDLPGIKFIQATKGIPAAQQVLLAAVEKQVKGVAEATASPFDKMRIAMGEASEKIGTALLPTVSKLAEKLAEIIPRITAFAEKHQGLIQIIAGLSAGLLVFGTVLSVVGTIMMANPIALIIAGIVAGVALLAMVIYKYWEPIKTFFINLWDGIKNIFSTVINVIWKYIYNFTPIGWIMRLWKPLSGLFSAIWDIVKTVFSKAIGFVKYILFNFTPIGLIFKHWDKLKPYFQTIWDFVSGIFKTVVDYVSNLGKKFYEAGANIVNSIIDGIKSKINAITETIKGLTQKIRDFLPFSPAKVGPLKTLHKVKIAETIAATIKPAPVVSAMQRMTGQGVSAMNNSIPVYNNNGGGMHVNLTVNLSGSASQQDATNIFGEFKKQADSWYRNMQAQNKRVAF